LGEMQDAAIFFVGNLDNRHFPFVSEHHPAGVMHLSSAGGIEGRTIEYDGMPSIMRERFDNASVELVEERIAVVEAVVHG
jgi:hypothetical protein